MSRDKKLEADLTTMALTVWAEARGESVLGQRAVAWVIRNRFEHPGWWSRSPGIPYDTIAAVCLCPWQFSCWNATDPNRLRLEQPVTQLRADYRAIYALCVAVLAESPEQDPTVGSDHYCTRAAAQRTPWAQSHSSVITIGNHVFYRLGLKGTLR